MTKFTAKSIQHLAEAGYHKDDDCIGLYLQVTHGKSGINKSWVFCYTSPITQKKREMGLGSYRDKSLKEARELARECRKQILEGIDPKNARDDRLAVSRKKSAIITFAEASKALIKSKRHEWRNQKHAEQWSNTLETYAFPSIGGLQVCDIKTENIVQLLEENNFWIEKTETAKRVQQRIASVLDWSKARGYIKGDNPAIWKGHLEKLLPNPTKLKSGKHHPALPFIQIHEFVTELRGKNAIGALGFEFLILTATRTNMVTKAEWDEFDVNQKIWNIPAGRMKAGKDFRVPLSDAAMGVIQRMNENRQNQFVFPSPTVRNQAISNNAFCSILDDMPEYSMYTVHGFRSTFRDWAAETMYYANETVELAISHTIKNKSEAAYRRGDQLDKRRQLMEDWSNYINTKPLLPEEPLSVEGFIEI